MTLHQLRIFAATAKHLSVTKASDELKITQSSVSQQLKLLEGECAIKLLKKVGRGIGLTERGYLFLSDVEPILHQLKRIKEKFKNNSLTDQKVGFLTVGASRSQSGSLFPILLAAFKKTHPQVQVTFRTDNSRMIEQAILNSEIEIGLITNSSYASLLIYEPYQREKLVPFVALNHPLAKKKKGTLRDLSGTPLVIRAGRGGKIGRVDKILMQLENRGIQLDIAMRCESPEAVKSAVKSEVGVGILYRGDYLGGDINPDERDLKIINIPELKMKIDIFIIYPKEIALSSNAQDFLTLLREWRKKKQGTKALKLVA